MATAAVPVLLESALRSLILAAIVWGIVRLLRLRAVRAQKTALGLVLLAALIMPLVLRQSRPVVFIPGNSLAKLGLRCFAPKSAPNPMRSATADTRIGSSLSLPNTESEPSQVSPAGASRGPADPIRSAPAYADHAHARPDVIQPAPAHWPATLAALALPIYLVIAGVLVLRLLVGLAVTARIWHTARPLRLLPAMEPASGHFPPDVSKPDAWFAIACGIAPQALVPQSQLEAEIRVSSRIPAPVNIGAGILLPAAYSDWDDDKLRIVLAHELAHVRQGDFYLQILASLYAALYWFSPLGWWLKRKLADLGEALSDHAGLEVAADRSLYAQILLEFAALQPRRPLRGQLFQPTTGVAMARPSSIPQRIERILNDQHFGLAFRPGKRSIVLAAGLVPVALVAATVLIRVQAVEAASPTRQAIPQAITLSANQTTAQSDTQAPAPPAAPSAPQPPTSPNTANTTGSDSESQSSAEASSQSEDSTGDIQTSTGHSSSDFDSSFDGKSYSYLRTDGDDVVALISGKHNAWLTRDGDQAFNQALANAQKTHAGDFVFLKRNGKCYLIDDPAIVAKAKSLYSPMNALGIDQTALGHAQSLLGKDQAALGRLQAEISVSMPDIGKEMAEANKVLKDLNLAARAKVGAEVNAEVDKALKSIDSTTQAQMESELKTQINARVLAQVDARLAEVQSQLDSVQRRLDDKLTPLYEKQSLLGEQQGKLGEAQGELGGEQGRLGELQGKLAKQTDRKMKSLFDEAIRDGKAKPIQ